jgi:hypothetical protein
VHLADGEISLDPAQIIPPGIGAKQLLTLDEFAALQPIMRIQGGAGQEAAVAAIFLYDVPCRNPVGELRKLGGKANADGHEFIRQYKDADGKRLSSMRLVVMCTASTRSDFGKFLQVTEVAGGRTAAYQISALLGELPDTPDGAKRIVFAGPEFVPLNAEQDPQIKALRVFKGDEPNAVEVAQCLLQCKATAIGLGEMFRAMRTDQVTQLRPSTMTAVAWSAARLWNDMSPLMKLALLKDSARFQECLTQPGQVRTRPDAQLAFGEAKPELHVEMTRYGTLDQEQGAEDDQAGMPRLLRAPKLRRGADPGVTGTAKLNGELKGQVAALQENIRTVKAEKKATASQLKRAIQERREWEGKARDAEEENSVLKKQTEAFIKVFSKLTVGKKVTQDVFDKIEQALRPPTRRPRPRPRRRRPVAESDDGMSDDDADSGPEQELEASGDGAEVHGDAEDAEEAPAQQMPASPGRGMHTAPRAVGMRRQ